MQKLLSEEGKKHDVSTLNVSDLHARLNTWVASATAKQIRELTLVGNRRTERARTRLLKKLQHIDAHLEMKVDDVLGTEQTEVVSIC